MDATRFDRLAKSLSSAGTRRSVLELLAALTAGSACDVLLGHDAGARGNGAGIGGHRHKRRRKRHKHGKRRRHKHRKTCKSKAQVCAEKCGQVTYRCKKRKKTVDCGPCACDPPCAGTAPICVDGVCIACSAAHPCANGCCAAEGSCQPGDTTAACGPSGTVCDVCTGDEVCDAAHGCTVPCGAPGEVCRVFVTSAMHDGSFDGLSGADAFCQTLAEAAGLPGTYKAWLSDATGSPSTRFTQAQGSYQLVDGTTIADNWNDLIDGSLDHAITIDEHGDPLPDPTARNDVWTATTPNGTRSTIGDIIVDCGNWSLRDFDHFGGLGTSSLADANWTEAGIAITCATRSRLYCFQQS